MTTMAIDQFGVQYSDDDETLLSCPDDLKGEYVIKDGVMEIAEGAFNECSMLNSIVIPESVRFLGEYAFCMCTGLVAITLPERIIKIEAGTFEGCMSLESIVIRNPKIDIAEDSGAFEGCDVLRKIVIPKGSKKHYSRLRGFREVRKFIVEE